MVLYNAGSPILSTILYGIFGNYSVYSVSVAVIYILAADASGLLEGGVGYVGVERSGITGDTFRYIGYQEVSWRWS